MSPHAFVDESARNGRYILCATLVDPAHLDKVRKLSRSLCLPGQRRWHFKSESDRRRRQVLDRIVRCEAIRANLYMGRGREVDARHHCLTELVLDLIDQKASHLIIESQDGQDPRDRGAIMDALHHSGGELAYAHLYPHGEPALWISDAIAWAYGAGKQWRQRVQPAIGLVKDLGVCRQKRETRPPTVRRRAGSTSSSSTQETLRV